jgi:hypothetical protein
MTEEKEPGRSAAADDGQQPDRGDDQLELAFGRGDGWFRITLGLFFVCHRLPARSWEMSSWEMSAKPRWLERRDTKAAGARAPLDPDAKVIMVNGTFRLPLN